MGEWDWLFNTPQFQNYTGNPANRQQGGFMGLGAPGTLGLIGGGLDLLSSLFGGGLSKNQKFAAGQAKGMLGQDIFNPFQQIQNYQQATAPQNNQLAQHLSRRLGLSSPLAQAGLARQQQSGLANFLMQGQQQNSILKSNRDQNLLQLLAGL